MLGLSVIFALSVACSQGGSERPSGDPLPPDLQAVLERVAAIRGLSAPPGIRVAAITREQIPDTLKATLTETDRTAFAHLTTLYRLLGHLGPNETYEDAYFGFAGNNLIGFYAPSQRTLYIVTVDGKSVDFASLGTLERSTIAHELTHALQDGSFDVQKLFAGAADDLDWSLALNSVLEGDAVNVEGLWTRDHAGDPGTQPSRSAGGMLPGMGSTDRGAAAPALASAPPSVEREFRFPYTTGVEWVSIVRSRSGNQPIDAALGGRRLTTAAVIHPDLFESGFEPQQVSLPDIATLLGSGWKHESGGAFGEFQLRNYLQLHLTALPATQAAAGWFGDRYDVYTNGAEAAALFNVRFASAEEAAQFAAAQDEFFKNADAVVTGGTNGLTAVFPGGQTTVRAALGGPDVLFVIGSSRDAAEAALSALSER